MNGTPVEKSGQITEEVFLGRVTVFQIRDVIRKLM